jgi:predicted deacylase
VIQLDNFKLQQIDDLIINDVIVEPGKIHSIKIYAGKLPSDTKISVYAHILHTGIPGPSLLLLGGVHGNEINGIEIVRRSLEEHFYSGLLRGTVIVIPLLNIYGFINFSRSVPDGKDVNRSFPGNSSGSLAARVARIITKNILPYVDVAIDFHTGGEARYNYPQVRFVSQDPIAKQMAIDFNTKYLIENIPVANSFRRAAKDVKVPAILFEGGESIRLDQNAIMSGTNGILRILQAFQMKKGDVGPPLEERFIIHKSNWLRASSSGLFIWERQSGEFVEKGEKLGEIKDPFGTKKIDVIAKFSGHIIGHNNACVVSLGDALFHIGSDFSKL